jgi:hypothetical protein
MSDKLVFEFLKIECTLKINMFSSITESPLSMREVAMQYKDCSDPDVITICS